MQGFLVSGGRYHHPAAFGCNFGVEYLCVETVGLFECNHARLGFTVCQRAHSSGGLLRAIHKLLFQFGHPAPTGVHVVARPGHGGARVGGKVAELDFLRDDFIQFTHGRLQVDRHDLASLRVAVADGLGKHVRAGGAVSLGGDARAILVAEVVREAVVFHGGFSLADNGSAGCARCGSD